MKLRDEDKEAPRSPPSQESCPPWYQTHLLGHTERSHSNPLHPSFLIFEMTEKEKKMGVRVRLICLVGRRVFVVGGDLLL